MSDPKLAVLTAKRDRTRLASHQAWDAYTAAKGVMVMADADRVKAASALAEYEQTEKGTE